MAEHRRVEPRQIAGTGMATDPERIQQVADEAERHARAWRPAPEAAFGDVLGRAPSRGELADEPPPRRPPGDDTDAASTAGATTGAAPDEAPPRPRPVTRASPRAPDPRARLLHARLDARQGPPGQGTTPPAKK